MKSMFAAAALGLLNSVTAEYTIMPPPASAKGDDVAIVWIHGMDCDPTAYTTFASEIQSQGANSSQRIWVGLPEFLLDAPEPILIDSYVTKTIKKLQEAGFTGDNILLAGHSLGGVMSQKYATKHSDTIKGSILMGSVLLRDYRSINDDGTSHFDYNVPTLTLGGTKDGLMRVTRLAEAYWHQYTNIEEAQAGMFPIVALEGSSHMSYMTGDAPKAVKKRDLVPDIDDETARQAFGASIVSFVRNVLKDDFSREINSDSATVLKPLVEGIEMEGSYQLKPPCYGHETENPDLPTCFHGNPWTNEHTQIMMGGTFDNKHIKVVNDDNFHRVQSVDPVHLPSVKTECDKKTTTDCTLNTITVSENKYDWLDKLDTGYYPIAASEIKTKLSSRQAIQTKGGNQFADFHELDEEGNRCAEINDASIEWAYSRLSKAAKANYDQFGQKYVTGDDKGPYNEGPLWIWTYMAYNESDDKKTVTVQAPMMRTPTDYFIGSAAGFHYCKVLSPFKVLEWMYVDGLLEFNGIKNQTTAEPEVFLQ